MFASPLARKTADEKGVSLQGIQGSGPNQRILQQDVLDFASQAPKKAARPERGMAAAEGEYEDIQLSNIRKVIAERLTYSKTNIPHYYVTVQVNMDRLLKLRTKLNSVSKAKISVNDMVIKAASIAAIKVPATNSMWMGDAIR